MKKALWIVLVSVLLITLSLPIISYAGMFDDKETIKQVQEALNEAGYDCGTPDGVAGDKTHSAIEKYKTDKGMSDSSSDITEIVA